VNAEQKERVGYAEWLRTQGRVDECLRICTELLNEAYDIPEVIFLVGRCFLEAGKTGLAHAMYMHFLQMKPNVGAAWNNLGRCYQELNALDESERCFRRVLRLEPNDPVALSNLGLVHLNRCEPEKTIEYCNKALALNEHFQACRHNLGLANLMLRNWPDGWRNYEASVGANSDRRERVYGSEERWDGSPGKTVIAYGEQGLGDEISFASAIPDFVRDCKEAVIECDERLQGLFTRSFPSAHVYGTRYKDIIDWADKHEPHGRVSFGSLQKFYRNKDEDFPGTPYLVADPERRVQWRALLASISDKPKIGISWQGGINKTGKLLRSVSLEALLPLLRQDATFVSVQYKNAQKDIDFIEQSYGIKVHHWARAVEAKDYDETAALVAELDLVISVTTAVIHLSGALGVPCIVLTPKHPMWRYGLTGETMPWYKSVSLIRQKKASDWKDPIDEAVYRLRQFLLEGKHGNNQLHVSDGISRRVA